MPDSFSNLGKGFDSPADTHAQITPSDTVDVPSLPRAIYCATAGTVAIRDKAGLTLTYAVTAGTILPFRATRIMATGTTATIYGWE